MIILKTSLIAGLLSIKTLRAFHSEEEEAIICIPSGLFISMFLMWSIPNEVWFGKNVEWENISIMWLRYRIFINNEWYLYLLYRNTKNCVCEDAQIGLKIKINRVRKSKKKETEVKLFSYDVIWVKVSLCKLWKSSSRVGLQ